MSNNQRRWHHLCRLAYRLGLILAVILLSVGPSTQDVHAATVQTSGHASVAAMPPFADVVDPAIAFFADNELVPGEVYTLEHFVPLDAERSIHITEHFTLASWRGQRRAALFMPARDFKGSFWTIPVAGYNGPAMAAERGMFAFTVDYLGVGQSFKPASGRHLNYLAQIDPMRVVLDYIFHIRQVRRVDLVGESIGGEVASQLAAEPQRVRSVVMSSMVYAEFSPEILPSFTDEFRAFLESFPNGYWQNPPPALENTPNELVRAYVHATQVDTYPTAALLEFWDLGRPLFDPSVAKVPGLVIVGSADPVPAATDPQNLAMAWGHGDAELVVIAGANHAPRIEAIEFANQYWDAVFDFWGVPEASVQQATAVTFHDIAPDANAGLAYGRVASARNAILTAEQATGTLLFPTEAALLPHKPHGAPGVALFDFDRDDDLDIYVTNGPGAANSLFANQLVERGQMTFIDVATQAGVAATDQDSDGVCFGDLDNDGDHDLLVLGAIEPNRLFQNQGNGAFADITAAAGVGGGNLSTASCAMGDVNGDGLLDIAIANTHTDWTNLLPFFGPDGPFPFTEHNQLFLNLGGNVFSDISATSGIQVLDGAPPGGAGLTWAIAMVDYDQDGDVDIFTADDIGLPHLFQNDGTGHFTDVVEEVGLAIVGSWMGLAFADFNCDSRLDYFMTNTGHYPPLNPPFPGPPPGAFSARWFLGQSDGTFANPGVSGLVATLFGWGTSAFDYDNDGDSDLVQNGGINVGFAIAAPPAVIMQNQGCGAQFQYDLGAFDGLTDHSRRSVQGLAVGDLNQDGFEDIVSVATFDIPAAVPLKLTDVQLGSPVDSLALGVEGAVPTNTPGVYAWNDVPLADGSLAVELNSAQNGNGSVAIRLLGGVGLLSNGRVNRDGIGGVVRFTPKQGQTNMQPIAGGSSYASQDSLTAHFGLGAANKGTIEVLWPGPGGAPVRNRLYNVHKGEHVLFPEIPCSYDGDWASAQAYHNCVQSALNELVSAGVITPGERGRFLSSALRAFHEAQSINGAATDNFIESIYLPLISR